MLLSNSSKPREEDVLDVGEVDRFSTFSDHLLAVDTRDDPQGVSVPLEEILGLVSFLAGLPLLSLRLGKRLEVKGVVLVGLDQLFLQLLDTSFESFGFVPRLTESLLEARGLWVDPWTMLSGEPLHAHGALASHPHI